MSATMINTSRSASMHRTDRSRVQRGWVFYDGRCAMCRAGARRFGGFLQRRGFALQPIQRAWVAQRLQLPRRELLSEMRVLTAGDRVLGGADALLYLAEFIWWARPLTVFARLPGGMSLLRRWYRAVAERRGCTETACRVDSKPARMWTWFPAVAVFLTGIASGPLLPPWAWMWTLAFSLYAACKWLAWRHVDAKQRRGAGLARNLGFLFAWPGTSAAAFLDRRIRITCPRVSEWMIAILKTSFGIALLWAVCRRLPSHQELLVGWVGMTGLIFTLHFGAFHLLSLMWRTCGVNAAHLFCWPIAATSLGDFWGNRWNGGFRQLAHDFIFRPMRRRTGIVLAILFTFFISGVVHDLVISVPARGGFGLPTAYFAIQGFGLFVERSRFGQRLGLRRGFSGRAFMIAMVAAPAFWLFHPPFVRNVILPFLKVIGSI